MSVSAIRLAHVSKVADATFSLFEGEDEKNKLLKNVEQLQDYFENDPEVFEFLTSGMIDSNAKRDVIEILRNSGTEQYLVNSLLFLLDTHLSFYFGVFLSTLKTKLNEFFKFKNVYVYSCFDIVPEQKKRIEELWSKRLSSYKCTFIYLIDKSLKLGVKVQVGNYIEEFTVGANLLNIKLKLESFLD